MSDIQELIHKTSMDCIEKGRTMEQERIIKLLEELISTRPEQWEMSHKGYSFEHLIGLIKGQTFTSDEIVV